jgi:hypothetical protein
MRPRDGLVRTPMRRSSFAPQRDPTYLGSSLFLAGLSLPLRSRCALILLIPRLTGACCVTSIGSRHVSARLPNLMSPDGPVFAELTPLRLYGQMLAATPRDTTLPTRRWCAEHPRQCEPPHMRSDDSKLAPGLWVRRWRKSGNWVGSRRGSCWARLRCVGRDRRGDSAHSTEVESRARHGHPHAASRLVSSVPTSPSAASRHMLQFK